MTIRFPWLTSILIALLVTSLSPPSLRANGPTVGRHAGAIFPVNNTNIQLAEERVTVNHDDDGSFLFAAPTHCEYRLRNLTDQKQTIEMSFLTYPTNKTGHAYSAEEQYHSMNFSVTIDGVHAEVEMVPAISGAWLSYTTTHPDLLPVWTVSFRPREERSVRISYVAAWFNGTSFKYLARVASLWAGPIENASIRFVVSDRLFAAFGAPYSPKHIFGCTASPGDYRTMDKALVWERTDWEPTEDFEISCKREEHRE